MLGSGIIPFNMTVERRAELAMAKTAGDDKKLKDLFQKQEEEDRAIDEWFTLLPNRTMKAIHSCLAIPFASMDSQLVVRICYSSIYALF
jgi:hypothetical protein